MWTDNLLPTDRWGDTSRSCKDGIWQKPADWISPQQTPEWGLYKCNILQSDSYRWTWELISKTNFKCRGLLHTICFLITASVLQVAISGLSFKKQWCVLAELYWKNWYLLFRDLFQCSERVAGMLFWTKFDSFAWQIMLVHYHLFDAFWTIKEDVILIYIYFMWCFHCCVPFFPPGEQ